MENGHIVIKLDTLKIPNYTDQTGLLPLIISAFRKKYPVTLYTKTCQITDYGFGKMSIDDRDEVLDDKGGKCGPGILEYYKILKNGNIEIKLDTLEVCYFYNYL